MGLTAQWEPGYINPSAELLDDNFVVPFPRIPGQGGKVLQSKKFALVAMAIMPFVVGAQNKTYTVRQGDTISEIASHHKVRRAELIAVNALPNSHKLQPGMVLRIPARKPEALPLAAAKGTAYYTVRNGDFDWTLAKRNGISVSQLKGLNPGVDFSNLQVGTRIAVPAGSVAAATVAKSSAKPSAKVALRTHKVTSGEHDWIIAKHAGVTLTALREANPGVNLAKLQIGQVLRVPVGSISTAGSSRIAKATPVAAPRIRTAYAVVAGSGSTIRRTPSLAGEKVTAVDAGTRVKVLDREGDWYRLKFPKGTVGWMRADLLKPAAIADVAKDRRTTRVAKNSPAPKKSIFKPVTTRTRTARSSSRPSLTAGVSGNRVVDTALSQLGKSYRWGSTSPSRGGFDCSGLVTYAYNKAGVKLPRTSRAMSSHGQAVSKGNMKPGDLVFFHTGRSSRVNHVAMYIGNGKIVHSSSGQGGVRIDSINSGYYARKMVSARRVLKPSSGVAQKPKAPKPSVDTE